MLAHKHERAGGPIPEHHQQDWDSILGSVGTLMSKGSEGGMEEGGV